MLRHIYKQLSKLHRKLKHRLLQNSSLLKLYRTFYHLGKIKENQILFECNAGSGYYGELRSIYEFMLSSPDYAGYEFIWSVKKYIGHKNITAHPRTKLVKYKTLSWLKAYSQSHYIFTNKPVSSLIKKRTDQCFILCADEVLDHGMLSYRNVYWPIFDYALQTPSEKKLLPYKIVASRNKLLLEPYQANCCLGVFEYESTLCKAISNNTLQSTLLDLQFKLKPNTKIIGNFLDDQTEYKKLSSFLNNSDQYHWFRYGEQLDYYVLLLVADLIVTDNISVVSLANQLQKSCIFVNRYSLPITDCGLAFTEVASCFFVPILLSIADYNMLDPLIVSKTIPTPEQTVSYDRKSYYAAIGKNITPNYVIPSPNPDTVNSLAQVLTQIIAPVSHPVTSIPSYAPDTQKKFHLIKELCKRVDLRLNQLKLNVLYVFKKRGFLLTANERTLLSYKNKYKGKRCFLIGNGPSLSTSDLEMIEQEYTFACNRIYKLFPSTTWRPSFYCLIDGIISKYESNDIAKYITCPIFTNKSIRHRLIKHGEIDSRIIASNNLGLSDYHITKDFFKYYIPSGATVLTYMIELAIYMGFEELYLLGVDCTSGITTAGGHCTKNYVSPSLLEKDKERIRKRLGWDSITNQQVADYYFNKSTLSYHIIKNDLLSRNSKVIVRNCSRGGLLEVYDRIALENVIS